MRTLLMLSCGHRPFVSAGVGTDVGKSATTTAKMSGFKQEKHAQLMIPGPIEISDDGKARAHRRLSHVLLAVQVLTTKWTRSLVRERAPVHVARLACLRPCLWCASHAPTGAVSCEAERLHTDEQDCLRGLRKVVFTDKAQPFILAGSGTLGWDLVAANLIEPDERALVLNSGYFGDSFADCLETYGAHVDQVKAPAVGGVAPLDEVEKRLKEAQYKLVTFTHVDTSTGVLSDAKQIGELVKRVSPDTLVVLDGVCSVASEEIRMDDWNIDAVVGASQKGLGVPPGLSVTVFSQRALAVVDARKHKITSYFANLKRWLPVMQSYEAGAPIYFATPSVQLIYALQASLKSILSSSTSLEDRFESHKRASQRVKDAAQRLGFKQLAANRHEQANGMTALWLPDGVAPATLVKAMSDRGCVIAAGLLPAHKTKYVRVGHMGISVLPGRDDIDKVIAALEGSWAEIQPSK